MSSAEKTVMFTLPNLVSGQLACITGTAAGRSWDLSAGTFTIGRSDEHDMALATEPGVSKTHAKIIGQGDRYLIVDCESRTARSSTASWCKRPTCMTATKSAFVAARCASRKKGARCAPVAQHRRNPLATSNHRRRPSVCRRCRRRCHRRR